MARKEYKVGDRIFFECYDGSIESSIVIGVSDEYYIDDKGKDVHYKWLKTDEEGNSSMGIEDYNCLSPNDPKCKEIAYKYKKFDKVKNEIINSILEIMSPWESKIQSEIIGILKLKLHI